MEMITLCGDNCLECPRYLAKTDDELQRTAELWQKVGWSNTLIPNDEIHCGGCSTHKQCTYRLVACIAERGVEKCNQCPDFPCDKITDMLKRSNAYKEKCKAVCSDEEYRMLSGAFFHKEENLKK